MTKLFKMLVKSKITLAKICLFAMCAAAIFASILCCFGENYGKSILKYEKNNNTLIEKTQNISKIENNAEAENIAVAHQPLRGGVVIEASSKRVLLDEGMNARCFPASTTKVLTALCVIENLPLDRIVTVKKEAVGIEGSSIYLKEGQKISVRDLLLGLMLRSGNDAAVALALETSGSVEQFASLMNKTAVECGAQGSHFVNPHGLHDDNHYTTALDLALICAKAYEYDEFCNIVSKSGAQIEIDGVKNYIANKNKLLKAYKGANGVKTGYTKRSGRCLVGGAKRKNMQLISVVLNYQDMWNDTVRMLNYGFDNFQMTSLDCALLNKNSASKIVQIEAKQSCTSDWQNVKYPLRKDGSEYLQIKSA